jgi:hypothetical protein
MTIDELAKQEEALVHRIRNIKGGYREFPSDYDSIFNEYEKIHYEYTNLAIHSSNIEALKRAVFIQWFEVAEPEFLSGIKQLDQESKVLVFDELQKIFLSKSIDEEFVWMLNCYYRIAPFFLVPRSRFRKVIKFLEGLSEWKPEKAADFSFLNRGQMGLYWQSRGDIKNFAQHNSA